MNTCPSGASNETINLTRLSLNSSDRLLRYIPLSRTALADMVCFVVSIYMLSCCVIVSFILYL